MADVNNNGYEDVLNRIQRYFSDPNNKDKYKYIYGIDTSSNKVILKNKQAVTMDDIENNLVDYSIVEDYLNKQNEPKKEVLEEEEVLEEPTSREVNTLKDLVGVINDKDTKSLEEVLNSFAINPTTGLADVGRAIGIVTNNTINEAINCIKNEKTFSSNLEDYDVQGRRIKENDSNEKDSFDNIIDKSFNNILVYVDAAKLKGIEYNDKQKMQAKQTYVTTVKFKMNKLGLFEEKEESTNKEEVLEDKKEMSLELKPNKDIKKAGFADIFILTVIVLVYAGIIINLILKLR